MEKINNNAEKVNSQHFKAKPGEPFHPYRDSEKEDYFSKAYNYIMRVPNKYLDAMEKLCLIRLSQYDGDSGDCCPSFPTLAVELGLCEKQAKNVVKGLRAKGLLEKDEQKSRRGMKNHYRFLWHEWYELTDVASKEENAEEGTSVIDCTPTSVIDYTTPM